MGDVERQTGEIMSTARKVSVGDGSRLLTIRQKGKHSFRETDVARENPKETFSVLLLCAR